MFNFLCHWLVLKLPFFGGRHFDCHNKLELKDFFDCWNYFLGGGVLALWGGVWRGNPLNSHEMDGCFETSTGIV